MSSTVQGGGKRQGCAAALREFHVGEQFLLRHFTPHSVRQAYRRNWKELKGGTHHAILSENCCDTRRCRRNRGRQYGSSRSLVRLPSSLLQLRWRRMGNLEWMPTGLDHSGWRLQAISTWSVGLVRPSLRLLALTKLRGRPLGRPLHFVTQAQMKLTILFVVVVGVMLVWWLRGVKPKRGV